VKVIKISDETYKRLIVIRGDMEKANAKIVSMDKVVKAILDERQQ
jgi:hypothetical protein